MVLKIGSCRICGSRDLVEVLDLGVQVLTGVFPRNRGDLITSGPLKLVKCMEASGGCGLLQLGHSYDLSEMYGQNYGYRSGLNPSMVQHLHNQVKGILSRISLEPGALVLDIGSNDGTTLRGYPQRDCTLAGIDPTAGKFQRYYASNTCLIPEFFSAAAVKARFGEKKRASIITSFSMFYDLEEPLTFMQEAADLLDEGGLWLCEQSYMPTMLQRNSYDTVCHEHLEYYTLKQVAWMATRVGLKVIDVVLNDVNGGSFSVLMAKERSSFQRSANVDELLAREREGGLDTLRPYREFQHRVERSREELLEFLHTAVRSNLSVCGLGASTKGNVLLQYCRLTEAEVSKIGEVNAEKYGCFTPGTLLPIVPQDEVLAEDPDYLLVLPWHFRRFFEGSKAFSGRKLVFPLPTLDITTV